MGPAQVGVPLTGSPPTRAPSVAVLTPVQLPSVRKPCPDTNKKKWGLTMFAVIRFVWGQLGTFLRDSDCTHRGNVHVLPWPRSSKAGAGGSCCLCPFSVEEADRVGGRSEKWGTLLHF